jgi:hypothetical protein
MGTTDNPDQGDKLQVWKCSFEGVHFITEHPEDLLTEIKEMRLNETSEIQRIEMTRGELEELPEFEGF